MLIGLLLKLKKNKLKIDIKKNLIFLYNMSTKESSFNDNLTDVSDNNKSNKSNKSNKDAEDKTISNEFKEKVKTFIIIDDAIRNKQDEIKELRSKKKICEEFILNFLQKSKLSHVSVSSGKLIKNETETKIPLKLDIIKESINEKVKKEKIFDTDEKYNNFVESIMDTMENKRPMQKRINLKRTFNKQNTSNNKE